MSNPQRQATFAQTAKMSVSTAKSGPMEPGPRAHLDQSIRQTTIQQPFTKALFHVNRQLSMFGDKTLDPAHAQHYATLAHKVETREVSNSYAHFSAAGKWASKGNITGVIMNTLGGLAAGAHDAYQYKTGR